QVGAVLVHLDTGLGFRLGVGVPADVTAPLHDQHSLAQLGGHPLGDRQTEEAGSDDYEVYALGHRQLGYPTATAHPESRITTPSDVERSRFAHDSISSHQYQLSHP